MKIIQLNSCFKMFLQQTTHSETFPTAMLASAEPCLGFSVPEFSPRWAALKTSGPWIINIYHAHILPWIILQNGMRLCHYMKKWLAVYLWKQGRHWLGHYLCPSLWPWPLTQMMSSHTVSRSPERDSEQVTFTELRRFRQLIKVHSHCRRDS